MKGLWPLLIHTPGIADLIAWNVNINCWRCLSANFIYCNCFLIHVLALWSVLVAFLYYFNELCRDTCSYIEKAITIENLITFAQKHSWWREQYWLLHVLCLYICMCVLQENELYLPEYVSGVKFFTFKTYAGFKLLIPVEKMR